VSVIRRDHVTGELVVISGSRGRRPRVVALEPVVHRGPCPFCTPEPQGPRIISNTYPLFVPPEGEHDVVVHGSDHDRLPGDDPEMEIQVFELVAERIATLRHRYAYASWFRNAGAFAGASQPHPHSQIVGSRVIPPVVRHAWEADAEGALGQAKRAGTRTVSGGDVFVFAPEAPGVTGEIRVVPLDGTERFDFASPDVRAKVAIHLAAAMRAVRARGTSALNIALIDGGPPGSRWFFRVMPRASALAGLEVGLGLRAVSEEPEDSARELRRVWDL